MNKGILIFAHNSREVDYVKMSVIAGALAKKNLSAPVSLVSDKSTLEWAESSGIAKNFKNIFENVITVEKPASGNYRNLFDGSLINKTVPFENANRATVWDITPYERTLLIDSDFLIFSKVLDNYWNFDSEILISEGILNVYGDKPGTLDSWVSDEGVKMVWATTVMFTKNQRTKLFFDLVNHIRKNWDLYSDIYRYNSRVYRNDISFSIAKHMLTGYDVEVSDVLPKLLTLTDKDLIHSVHNTGVRFLLNNEIERENSRLINISDRDIHIMNKQSITREYENFLEII